MVDVAILIASHINYKGQINLLDKCILSLLEQTLIPKSIYISLSFDNEIYKKDFINILKKYYKLLFPKINFKFCKEKMFQMEHLYNLISNFNMNNYDMLMFCDDDDTYKINRIEKFVYSFKYFKNMKNFGGVRELKKIKIINGIQHISNPEYWCYGIIPNVIVDFFNIFKSFKYNILKHKFGDMYFRGYLRNNTKYCNWGGTVTESDINVEKIELLYNYNINNPNSICGKIQCGLTNNKFDELLIKMFNTDLHTNFNKMLNKNKNNIDKKSYKFLKDIYDFCKFNDIIKS